MEKRRGITVAGSLIADVFYAIDTYPDEGLLTKVNGIDRHIGGSGNLILDLAKLDPKLPIDVSAIVGDDINGEMLLNELAEFPNIQTEAIRQQGQSSVTHVMNAKDTLQRTFFFQGSASDLYDINFIDWNKLNSRIFHLEYLLLMEKVDSPCSEYGTHGAKILAEAQKQGMKTSIDMVSENSGRVKNIIQSCLKYTNYCSINEVEAEIVTGIPLLLNGKLIEENIEEALLLLQSYGVSDWVVIHSPTCSYGLDCSSQEIFVVPSLSLPDSYIKGTTGAGDAYCSGILYGAHQAMTIKEAMELATACAACSLSCENGTDGMRHLVEVQELANKFSLVK